VTAAHRDPRVQPPSLPLLLVPEGLTSPRRHFGNVTRLRRPDPGEATRAALCCADATRAVAVAPAASLILARRALRTAWGATAPDEDLTLCETVHSGAGITWPLTFSDGGAVHSLRTLVTCSIRKDTLATGASSRGPSTPRNGIAQVEPSLSGPRSTSPMRASIRRLVMFGVAPVSPGVQGTGDWLRCNSRQSLDVNERRAAVTCLPENTPLSVLALSRFGQGWPELLRQRSTDPNPRGHLGPGLRITAPHNNHVQRPIFIFCSMIFGFMSCTISLESPRRPSTTGSNVAPDDAACPSPGDPYRAPGSGAFLRDAHEPASRCVCTKSQALAEG
jgi:hypothetical protein